MSRPTTKPNLRRNLIVAADFGHFTIHSAAPDGIDLAAAALLATDDAYDSRRYVGVCRRTVISLVTPGEWSRKTPVSIEVWPGEPPSDDAGWDHEVDADLDVPAGRLCFLAGGHTDDGVGTPIPAGDYRVRVSARGLTHLGLAGVNGEDSYRLQLWPRGKPTPPLLRRRWPGWADLEI